MHKLDSFESLDVIEGALESDSWGEHDGMSSWSKYMCERNRSVAEVRFRTDAENQNWQNWTESSVQFSTGSPFLAMVQFSVLRMLQNSQTVWEPLKIFTWNAKNNNVKQLMYDGERL